jgi:dihydroorotate dehydrogenase electron transfer subunit
LAEAWRGGKCVVFIGGKTQNDILGIEDFKKLNSNILVATEDGSLGIRGTVVDLFLSQTKQFKGNRKYYIYACGPMPMLKSLAQTVKFKKFICQVSLEARMGCGFGACWGCVVKTKHPRMPYQRVCQDGPVFRLEDIAWE